MATVEATDQVKSGPGEREKAVVQFSDVDGPDALLDIIDELDRQLVAVGDAPATGTESLPAEVSELREQLAFERSEAGTARSGWVRGIAEALGRALEQALRRDPATADPATPHARALRRLEIWRLLVRPIDAIVDFPRMVKQVCDSPAISTEAASINYRVDVLAHNVRARHDEILGNAQREMNALAAARAELTEHVIDHLTATRAATPPPAKGVTRLVRWLPRFERATAAGASAAPDAADGPRIASLEADVLEAAAAANQIVVSAIELAARALLSVYAEDLTRTELRLAATDGLAQVVNDRLEINTEAADRLAKLLQRMRGGSVGIAGPRGAGKSTIIRRFCDGRESIGGRTLLSVAVAAPVVYDSRDFMLHLFAESCRQAGAVPAPADPPDRAEQSGPDLPAITLRTVASWLPVLGLWLALGAIATLVSEVVDSPSPFVAWGVAALLGATALIAFRHPLGPRLKIVMAMPLGLLGAALVAAGIFGATWSSVVPKVVTLAAIGAFAYGVGTDLRLRLGSRRPDELAWTLDRMHGGDAGWPPSDDDLVRVASLRLEELRYQQTVTTGVSGKLSVPPVIEVGATAERSLARHPMTFPELVDSFAKFLALAAQTRDVLIAIDELDKLEPNDDTATRFLNDLKAAFGIANTYFLVSVSEDAMSRFERRGLPFRDVFDSTFDEILRVEPLSLEEARKLLGARVVGLPYIYAALCYVLSGGIPRDLIRTARRVVDVNDRVEDRDKLEAIVRRLMADELESKALAVEHAALALHPTAEELRAFLDWIEAFRSATAKDTKELTAFNRLVDYPAAPATPTQAALADRQALSGLADELGAYGYFAAAVLDFFKDSLTEPEVERAAVGADGAPPELELLARARMSFSIDAGAARKAVDTFRARPIASR